MDNQNYVMPIKAIKNILGKELAGHYEYACRTLHDSIARSFVHNGYYAIKEKLGQAQTYDDIDEVLSMADYRMSVQEWIDSL